MNKEQKLKSKQSVKDFKLWRAGWNNGYQEAREEFNNKLEQLNERINNLTITSQYPNKLSQEQTSFNLALLEIKKKIEEMRK